LSLVPPFDCQIHLRTTNSRIARHLARQPQIVTLAANAQSDRNSLPRAWMSSGVRSKDTSPTAVVALNAFNQCANSPILWGSRVVAKKSGPSDTMVYQFNGDIDAIIRHGSESRGLNLAKGRCIDTLGRIWGSPCRQEGKYVYLTVTDVRAQDLIFMIDKNPYSGLASAAYFVPKCEFPPPAKDEVDLRTSFPFSRFVHGMESFKVDFAIQGANSNSPVRRFTFSHFDNFVFFLPFLKIHCELLLNQNAKNLLSPPTYLCIISMQVDFSVNGKRQCSWSGIELNLNAGNFCANMQRDEQTNLRIFHGVFPRKTNVTRESFTFSNNRTFVVVSIDYTQTGT
uniref:CIA30 domain-containing protein n=1 Tax=Hydatigena taeniaeformis TaxID=6205 RepID=A0A0R3WLW8_HYDTA